MPCCFKPLTTDNPFLSFLLNSCAPCCLGFSFTATERSKSIHFRALLIAKKLKAKQGRKEENSVDKLAEKVGGHRYDISTSYVYRLLQGACEERRRCGCQRFRGRRRAGPRPDGGVLSRTWGGGGEIGCLKMLSLT